MELMRPTGVLRVMPATQDNLGNALITRGERESGTARLEEAVAAYRAALQERTRERAPLGWAATQNNLGTALLEAWGARERYGTAGGGGGVLSRGIEGNEPASRFRSTGAVTENNLGGALWSSARRRGRDGFDDATTSYKRVIS